ncbi:MAG TPA: hypothetical protein ACYCDB_00710 [Candidatus Azoamicus sp.]
MSKICIMKREKRRQKLVKQFFSKRKKLRKIINDVSTSIKEKNQHKK